MAEITTVMGINVEELIEYACKGISTEISEREKTIREGRRLINQIKTGQKAKTKLTVAEIEEIISQKRAEIEELSSKRFDYNWELILHKAE